MEFPPATHLRPNPCVLAEQGLIPVLNFSLGDYGGTVRQIVDAPWNKVCVRIRCQFS